METTIKIKIDTKEELNKIKIIPRESYNEVINFLIKDYHKNKQNGKGNN